MSKNTDTIDSPIATAAIKLAAEYYHISIENVHSKKRSATRVRARSLASWLIREAGMFSLCEISEIIALDHSSIGYGIRRVEKQRRENNNFREEIDTMLAEIIIETA